jgi:hypothetical protein
MQTNEWLHRDGVSTYLFVSSLQFTFMGMNEIVEIVKDGLEIYRDLSNNRPALNCYLEFDEDEGTVWAKAHNNGTVPITVEWLRALFDATTDEKNPCMLAIDIELNPPNGILVPVGEIRSRDITSILFTPPEFSKNNRPTLAFWFVDAFGQQHSLKETHGFGYMDRWKMRGRFKSTAMLPMTRGINLNQLAAKRLSEKSQKFALKSVGAWIREKLESCGFELQTENSVSCFCWCS